MAATAAGLFHPQRYARGTFMKFRGLFTALVTPFDVEGEVNFPLLRQLIRLQIEAQVDGLVVLGTTGEEPTLTAKEKSAIIALAREETEGKIPLLVGTG